MIDPALLAAFAAVTGLVSLVPGPQMLFVLTQTAWRGHRAGIAALAGLQLGNALWFVLAGLGLGALALAAPQAFIALTLAGALYLAWLGIKAWREAGDTLDTEAAMRPPPRHRAALRDSLAVALSNPKSLVYVVALLPPFVDRTQPIAPQLVALAAIAIVCDLLVGAVYVAAGGRLAAAMQRPHLRARLERGIGAVFILIALGVLTELVLRGSGA